LLLLAVLPLAELVMAMDAASFKVGVFPRRTADWTRQMFQPMMDYLQRELNTQVILDVPPDFQAFWEQVAQGRYNLVHFNQYQYLVSHKQFGYQAVLMNEELGRSRIASVIWVRKDSGIRKPLDLKGKKIIFGGGKQAMVSYIMAVDLLRRHGLEEHDYLRQFAINPVNALVSLYYRQGMAAGAGDLLPQLFTLKKGIDLDELEPLLKSQSVAHLPWAVGAEIPPAQARRIQHLMVKLKASHKGRKILARAGLTALVPACDDDYTPHREIINRVSGEHF
jgi:phosphonate transport system substrate-binding protein